jgi:hypothetical protein
LEILPLLVGFVALARSDHVVDGTELDDRTVADDVRDDHAALDLAGVIPGEVLGETGESRAA